MAKARNISLDGFTLTAIITAPDAAFVEFSKPDGDGVTTTVTFVDRGSNGLDRGDKIITSRKLENAKNQSRHWETGDEILNKFGKKLKEIVDGARADRQRASTQIPQSFGKGTCAIFGEDCTAEGAFKIPLTPETKFNESTYSENDLCPSAGGGLTSFDPAMCEQVHSQFEYTRADGKKFPKAEVRRLTDLDEELGYTNTYGLDPQLGQYYQTSVLQDAALDVFYSDASGAKYLHLDLRKIETPPQAAQL